MPSPPLPVRLGLLCHRLLGTWGTSEYGVYVKVRPTRRHRPSAWAAPGTVCAD